MESKTRMHSSRMRSDRGSGGCIHWGGGGGVNIGGGGVNMGRLNIGQGCTQGGACMLQQGVMLLGCTPPPCEQNDTRL